MRRAFVALLVWAAAGSALVASGRAADAPVPSAWPSSPDIRPRLEGGAHSLRFFGDNRYQTALSASLLLHGSGRADSYPFGSPDPATTAGWWGFDTCPRSIIVVAGDNPADALTASSLSDPTGLSSEPYVQRSAAADPLFFPPGGFARVDTDFAPILTTRSVREGATQLDLATRVAAQELSRGACGLARQAIIVGGVRAVSSAIESELVSIGYDEVFRIAGSSRYHTARLVAEALGTRPAPGSPPRTTCVDASSRNGTRSSFYANSVVEYRESPDSCRLLGRTVVLADGIDGIDALASGWWTSYWQVPVLLTAGTGVMPVPTREALQTLDVDSIVVLGGESRVPNSVVEYAVELSGAVDVVRVAGVDRYATSIEVARRFGGWWGTNRRVDSHGSALCVAASTGGTTGTGWPDALVAGPWCARAALARATSGAPVRALAPIAGGGGLLSNEMDDVGVPSHFFVPMLLVPTATSGLPRSVDDFLRSVFPSDDDVCSGEDADPDCLSPGFVYVAGGPAVVSADSVGSISAILSGGQASDDAIDPSLRTTFATRLSLGPVYDSVTAGPGATAQVCVPRGSYDAGRWLVVGPGRLGMADLVERRAYGRDRDGIVRTPGIGTPVCISFDADDRPSVTVDVVGPTGRRPESSQVRVLGLADDDRFDLSASLGSDTLRGSSGSDSGADASAGGETNWSYEVSAPGVTASSRGETAAVTQAAITLSLLRGVNRGSVVGVDTFDAEFEITTAEGSVRGRASGEALFVEGRWLLRGVASFGRGSWNFDTGRGGFVAEIDVGAAGAGDDSLSWRLDGQM